MSFLQKNGRLQGSEEDILLTLAISDLLLSPVLSVDLHVFGGQVAGPHRGAMRAAGAEIDLDREVLAGQVLGRLRRELVERDGRSRTAPASRSARGRRRARTPRPSGRPPRRGVPSSDRRRAPRSSRAASWRSPAPPSRRRHRWRAGDGDRDQLGRALAAADDAERELVRHGAEAFEQRRVEVLVDRRRRWRRWPARTRSRWSTARRQR